MREKVVSFILALAGSIGLTSASDLSGTWFLDPSESLGLPAGLQQTLVVEQSGDDVKVHTTLVTDTSDRTVDDQYVIGGGERDFDPQNPNLTNVKAKRTTVRADGGFDARDHITGDSFGAPTELDIERKWRLDSGGTLSIEQATTIAGSTARAKRVFTKSATTTLTSSNAPKTSMFPVDLRVPFAPTEFQSGGKANVAYELHVTSFRNGDLEWSRLEVLDDTGKLLASYAGPELASLLAKPGNRPDPKTIRRLAGGSRSVAYLWLTPDVVPRSLQHRAYFTVPASGSAAERVAIGGDVTVAPKAIVIGPPFRGHGWVPRWMSNTSFHRRGLMVLDGRAVIGQRFAIDWNRYGDDGREWHNEGKQNTDYTVYGEKLIAVADGTVARVVDGIPENVPPSVNPNVPMNADTAAGNAVSLEIGPRVYATYAHMQPGSIRVKEGQRIRKGEILGLVGNSGNAIGPHLHFHLSTGPLLTGEGLPYVFDSFAVLGTEDDDAQKSGEWKRAAGKPDRRRNEMPVEHTILAFDNAS